MENLKDPRKKAGKYALAEIITASIALFIFKEGSRNAMNQSRLEGYFSKNYHCLFKLKLPHMDTVNDVFKRLEEEELETLKNELLHTLITKKVLHKWRFLGKWFMVAFDATGVHSYTKHHCEHCLTKTSKMTIKIQPEALKQLASKNLSQDIIKALKKLKTTHFKDYNEWKSQLEAQLGRMLSRDDETLITKFLTIEEGKTSYFHNVLEAKIICANGFSISLGTEWIENVDEDFDKQDCERNGFKRLSAKIKKSFQQLPICVVADGLYPNEPFFETCKMHKWTFIPTFKDGNLPTIQKRVRILSSSNNKNRREENLQEGNTNINRKYHWINNLKYRKTILHWVECVETKCNGKGEVTKTTFVYLCSEEIDYNNIKEVIKAGRLRQNIENEGFNSQKNLGYSLKHKYSRKSLLACKNYYQCLQIAHIINQLMELSTVMQTKLDKWKTTLRHCWKAMFGFLTYGVVDEALLKDFIQKKVQYRYLS